MKVYAIDGIVPVVDPAAYVHPSAVLIGDVVVGAGAYVGPCASLRGDFGRLFIGVGANVQDCCVMHGFPGSDTIIEENGHIGHGASRRKAWSRPAWRSRRACWPAACRPR
jgi:phenylacetic acid degradation protein